MSVESSHNAGFFSCCSVKLTNIVDYINLNSKIPINVDSSKQFYLYKIDNMKDVTYDFFEHYDNITDVDINYPINYHYDYQYNDYTKLDYDAIIPVVKKYFSPSKNVLNIVENIEKKYKIDYDNTIAVYYRGTDKYTEMQIPSFDEFYSKIKEISELYLDKQIIIQTDSSQFMDYIHNTNLKNVMVFNENTTTNLNIGIHLQNSRQKNYNDMLNLFSIFLILSKCKNIICNSGNCSIWMMLYRGNNKNITQYMNGTWYNTV